MQRRSAPLLFPTLMVATFLAPAETRAQTLDHGAHVTVIDSLIAQLERAYVFPETAVRMGTDLRTRLARGEYNDLGDAESFAARLTEDLQAVSHDRHLRVRTASAPPVSASEGSPAPPTTPFGRTERLEGNIAYIEITTFGLRLAPVRDAVRDVMDAAADASTLVIDLRRNGGGQPALVAHITSYLFGDEPIHLNSLYSRPQNSTQDFYTNPGVEGRKFGPDKPVFVLTSSRTFSAAEEFAYNLQSRKRATIVGETSAGGAHPGGYLTLPHGLRVFVPTGRAINPITGTNWEGTGVVPDVSVPADEALEAALRLAQSR